MEHSATLIAVFHILIAFFLVVVVLLQDSKGGGVGGSFGGGGGSQSIFGATGAAGFLVKVTRYLAVGFMLTCISLTIISAKRSSKSVVDSMPIPAPTPSAAPANSTVPTTPTPAAVPK